jgi:hypothetical protein
MREECQAAQLSPVLKMRDHCIQYFFKMTGEAIFREKWIICQQQGLGLSRECIDTLDVSQKIFPGLPAWSAFSTCRDG